MKLLVLTSRFPYPIEKGDKLRIYHQIRCLSQQHEIILCALSRHKVSDAAQKEMAQYCQSIHIFRHKLSRNLPNIISAAFKPLPFQVGYFWHKGIHQKIRDIVEKEKPDHIYCQLVRMAPYGMNLPVPATIDYMDCFSLGMRRRAEASLLSKRFLFWEARKLRRYEQAVFSAFKHHTIISAQDRTAMPLQNGQEVHIIPNGVDVAHFQPQNKSREVYDIVFVGNMGYFPNIQAANYLVKRIMPLVWKKKPIAKLLLAGARPSIQVRALGSHPNVDVPGWMEDIRKAYTNGRLLVAPLISGSGQQNKILEAMAMERPCITTSLVNNAIGARVGEEIMIAENPQTFASHILDLLADQEKREKLGKAGRQFVKAHFSWEGATERLNRIIDPSKTLTS